MSCGCITSSSSLGGLPNIVLCVVGMIDRGYLLRRCLSLMTLRVWAIVRLGFIVGYAKNCNT